MADHIPFDPKGLGENGSRGNIDIFIPIDIGIFFIWGGEEELNTKEA
jgi:hypothetical protein